MRLVYEAEQRFWLHIPASFPDGRYAGIAEWEADVVARYLESRPDASADELRRVRELARGAQRDLADTAVFGLQFWPYPAPVAVAFDVEVGPAAHGGAALEALLGGIPLAVPPSVDELAVPSVGDGVAARFLVDAGAGATPAGIGAIVSSADVGVRVLSHATTTTLVGLVDGPLRQLAQTFRLVPDTE